MFRNTFRRRGLMLATAATIGLVASATLAGASAAGSPAHAARSVNASEHVRLHLVHKSGSTLTEAGSASGTVSGSVSARLKIAVVFVSGSATIRNGAGSMTIALNGAARTVSRFGGSMHVTHGTGRYAHASGSGSFSGTVNRRTSAATVDVRGHLSY